MDIFSIISTAIGAKTFHNSYRNIEFTLSKESMDKLNSTRKRELFSGLEDIFFSFTNKSTKPIVIEEIIIEKSLQPLIFDNIQDPLTKNFHAVYHFYVSEKSFQDELQIVYGENTKSVVTRKYNLLKQPLTISPSEKKQFCFTKEQQFRELFYTFDGKIHAFAIVNIYVKDTLGNISTLSKKEKNAFIKASVMDSEIVEVFLNRFASTKLISIYLYLLSKNRKKIDLNDNHSTKAMSSYTQSEDSDIDDDMSTEIFEIDDEVSEMIKKDNLLLEESLKSPLSEEDIDFLSSAYKGEMEFLNVRKMTINEIKELKKKYSHLDN